MKAFVEFGHETSYTESPSHTELTLSGFSVALQVRGGGAQRPGCQKSKLTSTNLNETLYESLYP